MAADPASTAPAPAPSAPIESVDLAIEGMTCASCANRIERKLNRMEGVTASVNYATEKAHVSYAPGITADELIATVVKAGYGASVPEPEEDADAVAAAHLAGLRRRLVASVLLSVPVIALAMVPPWQFPGWQWVSAALALPVVLWAGWGFHRAAFANARHRTATMDTLVSIGTLAATLWSLYALFFGGAGTIGLRHGFELLAPGGGLFGSTDHGHGDESGAPHSAASVYFEVASGVIMFLLAGRYFEAKSKRTASAALRALMSLGAKEVTVVDGFGAASGAELSRRRIPVEQLAVGDVFEVLPGEKIAADGRVLEGRTSVDASMVTGESVPVGAGPGDDVVGGTINATARILVRAARVGKDTQLAQMAKLVEQAQSGKAEVQRLADRVSGVFVPVVLVLAVLTLMVWLIVGHPFEPSMTAAVAVLIIACPCALGLATPTALLVGTGRGAKMGVLIKGPEALEAARHLDAVVMDKTGTLTTGVMSVEAALTAAGESSELVLAVAGAVESGSGHPIAKAVARAAEEARAEGAGETGDGAGIPALTASAVENIDGLGARGVVQIPGSGTESDEAAGSGETPGSNGAEVFVGRLALLQERGCVLDDPALEAEAERLQSTGRTVVWAGWEGRVRGAFAVADTLRESTPQAVADLRALGLRTVLLTGDASAVAEQVGRSLAVDEIHSEVLPHEKVEAIRQLQAEGFRVAMIGDGVNDAAALAAADLGLAMGAGTDAAMEAADITLVRTDLADAVTAVRLARATLSTIRANLFWAFAYNAAAIPLAGLGLLNPMLAGAAMAFSSVFVVGNSLRLRSFR